MTAHAANPFVMVDDNEGDIYIVQYCFLKSKLKNAWIHFSSGPLFLDYLVKVKTGDALMPAMVLLDINMPQMTGFDVLQRTRADQYFAEMPIFCMLTSSSDLRDEDRSRRLGASGFFTKPTTVDAYVEWFNALIPLMP